MADWFVSHTSNDRYWVGAIGKELKTLGPVAHVHEIGDAGDHRLSETRNHSLERWVKGGGPFHGTKLQGYPHGGDELSATPLPRRSPTTAHAYRRGYRRQRRGYRHHGQEQGYQIKVSLRNLVSTIDIVPRAMIEMRNIRVAWSMIIHDYEDIASNRTLKNRFCRAIFFTRGRRRRK